MPSLAAPAVLPPLHAEPLTVSRETLDRLRAYAALLEKWTVTINLVGATDRGHIWSRHVQDSLRLLPLIPAGTARGIDLGSGAGLPGLVLAIATGIPFDLVESDRRKAIFLQEAARITAAPVQVHAVRIESLSPAMVPSAVMSAGALTPAALVTARALAPLDALLGYAAPLLAHGGTALFPKGANAAAELEKARRSWDMQVEEHASPGQPGVILAITNLRRIKAGSAHE